MDAARPESAPPAPDEGDSPKSNDELLEMLRRSRAKRRASAEKLNRAAEKAVATTPNGGTKMRAPDNGTTADLHLDDLGEAVKRARMKRSAGAAKLKRSVEFAVHRSTTFYDIAKIEGGGDGGDGETVPRGTGDTDREAEAGE